MPKINIYYRHRVSSDKQRTYIQYTQRLWKNLAKSYTICWMKIIGNSQYQKSLNGALILNYLLQNRSGTRIELAKQLGLQPSTITYIVNRFLNIDLVRESKITEKRSGSGRPAINLQINPDYGSVIGIEMQSDYYNAVICDITGNVSQQLHHEYSRPSASFEIKLRESIDDLTSYAEGTNLLGLGVATPGIVNPDNATIEESLAHNIHSLCISDFLDKNFQFPVVIENDANCCALHFLWENKNKSEASFLYVLPRFHNVKELPQELPGVGIGIGIVIEGKLYRGLNHRAGEFRSAFLRRGDKSEVSISIEETRQIKGNPEIKRNLIIEIIQNLGFSVSLLNPNFILIGGDLTGEKALFDEILSGELQAVKEYFNHAGCEVNTLQDVRFDAAQGAAANILNELYRVPQAGASGLSHKKWARMLSNAVQ